MKAVKIDTNKDLRSQEKVTLESPISWNEDEPFTRSETPQGIESLGEVTTQERRSATWGGVWLRTLAKHGQPVVWQWISVPLSCPSPEVELV